jgi:hypothetical protein
MTSALRTEHDKKTLVIFNVSALIGVKSMDS